MIAQSLNYVTATQGGFVEVYVYNASASPVWYDQFSISSSQAVIIQENHYYPFGMQIAGLELDLGSRNRYKFNGNEEQDDFDLGLYDFNARFYDPSLGRFMGVDVLADHPNQITMSPYQFGWNNPIRLNDPNGKCPVCPGFDYMLKGYKIATDFYNNISKPTQRLTSSRSDQIPTEISSNMSSSEHQMFNLSSQVNDANSIATEIKSTGLETGQLSAEILQDVGDGLQYSGLATGNAPLVFAGEVVSDLGIGLEIAVGYAQGKSKTSTVLYTAGTKAVLGSSGHEAAKAVKRNHLDKTANDIFQGFLKGVEDLGNWVKNKSEAPNLDDDLNKK